MDATSYSFIYVIISSITTMVKKYKSEKAFNKSAEAIIKKAMKEHRLPIECIEEVDNGFYTAKVVVYKEC